MFNSTNPLSPTQARAPDASRRSAARPVNSLFSLIELHPQLVMDGEVLGRVFDADPVVSSGSTREQCLHCPGAPLQLVLRQNRVIRPFLFCERCTRCYDAVDDDGNSALLLWGFPID